jgi:hypothetical protein
VLRIAALDGSSVEGSGVSVLGVRRMPVLPGAQVIIDSA